MPTSPRPPLLAAALALGVALTIVVVPAPTAAILHKPKTPGVHHVPEELWLNTAELVRRWGYPVETHVVQTDDGYLLEVQRVPGPRLGSKLGPKPRAPVLLVHGYGATSECMVLRPRNVLALMLADANFDVWIANVRGTFYGRRHVSLKVSDPRFWDFSWHENGVHDIAGMVDYILRETGQPSVLFSSYSMGGTALMALLSDRPEYNAKVRAGFLLAPAVYFRHRRGGFARIHNNLAWAYNVVTAIRMEDVLMRQPRPELCISPTDDMTVSATCWSVMAEAQGPFHATTNNTYMSVLLRHWPGGSNTGQMMHFGQLIMKGDGFRKFDFGPRRNREVYGTVHPPAYNLTNVQTPLHIYYSKNDYQAHYEDIEQLAADLPNVVGLHLNPLEYFNHLDIMYDEVAAEYVYKGLINEMTHYR